MRFILAGVLIARSVAAQPSMTPPRPDDVDVFPTEPALVHLELAARAGVSGGDVEDQSFHQGGKGPYLELEVGVRAPSVTLAVFMGYWSYHDSSALLNDLPYTRGDLHARFYDLGARLHVHLGRAFIGGGLGIEDVHETGTRTEEFSSTPGTSNVSTKNVNTLLELHAGYTLPALGPVSFQIMGMLTNSYGDDFTAPITARLALGAQF